MSAHALIESERVRASLASGRQRMLAGERRGELIVGTGFVIAAVSLALLGGGGESISLPVAALYVVSIAAVGHVRFDIGAGFTVTTQAVFVPMLFVLPVAWCRCSWRWDSPWGGCRRSCAAICPSAAS